MGRSRYIQRIIKGLSLLLVFLLFVQSLIFPSANLVAIPSPSTSFSGNFHAIDSVNLHYLPIYATTVNDSSSENISKQKQQLLQEQEQRQEQIDNLHGKSLDIYNLLVESERKLGVRDVQRHFDYSSPNLASYHLEKLYRLDLLVKTKDNRYQINPEAQLIGDYKDKVKILN